jgi:ketosteroid isomerase-like protein
MELTETPAAIRAFIDATNAGDSDAFVAAFTADATLDDWGRKFAGHAGVRDWDRTDNIGVQSHFDLLAIEAGEEPDSYVATMRVRGNGYNGTGPMVFRIRGGLVASLRISA